MDHVVYLDAKAKELDLLISGEKGMIIRGATGRKMPYGRVNTGDVLYFHPAAGRLTLETYLSRSLPYEGYPPEYDVRTGGWEGETVTPGIAAQAMGALAAGYRRVWLVEFSPEFWDPEGHLLGWLVDHGTQSAQEDFGRVRVYLYDLADEPSG